MNSDWYEEYLKNSEDPILRERYKMMFGRNQNISEESRKVLDLFEDISRMNQLYDRGPSFWLNLVLKIDMIGFLGYMVYWLLTWRPIP